jgi:glycosyltransferase involved in cell wall biosynthesis
MKIVHIIPGSGGTFYCQNCMRDNELIRALKELGHDVHMVPMYLPLNVDIEGIMGDTPVFYGAINVYLKEKVPFYRHAPLWLEKLFDSEKLLQLAAKKSGSTRATGLEEMTISMLMGENGRQATELDHLINFLKKELQPDVVHLSNALLLGLVHRIKTDLGATVVCSLQDENEWIDPMSPEYQEKVWRLMSQKAKEVDIFIAASQYYADRCQECLNLPREKIKVVYGGVCMKGYERSPLPMDPPTIGYLCRMSEVFGLGIIADAFITLKEHLAFKNLRLFLTGGYTSDDKPFVEKVKKKFQQHGVLQDVTIFEDFDREHRIEFLKSLTLLSVPVPDGEAFGAYLVEALASGVPIVEPNVGGYPEFVEKTGGGIIYEPNDGKHLAEAIASLLSKPEKIKKLGDKGCKIVHEQFTMKQMAENIIRVYKNV